MNRRKNRNGIVKIGTLFLMIFILTTVGCGKKGETADQTTEQARKMREDLNYLTDVLEREHKNLYANVSKEEFEERKKSISGNADGMSEVDFYYSLKSLLSLVRDAHTDIGFQPKKNEKFKVLPFQVQNYENKWILVAIDKKDEIYLGSEVRFINNIDINEVFEKMKSILSFENETRAKLLFSKQSNIWSALTFLGVAKEGDDVELGVEQADGKIHKVVIHSINKDEISPEKIAFVKVENLPKTAKNGVYRATDLNEEVLFVQYNYCQESPDLSMEQFTKKIEEALIKNNFHKVILDLRYNPGGDSTVLEPFIQMLYERKKEKKIEVYTLIGKETFSSAVMNAVKTKEELGAILVGEPTSGNVNAFGEIKTFSLKNFPMEISYSTKYFTLFPDYEKDSLYPEVMIPQDFSSILSGHDLEVEWVLNR